VNGGPLLLIAAVAAVGVLHTMVPDHWVPIALIARERGWSRAETVRAAAQAGTGHVLTTLAIAVVVWAMGAAFADRFGRLLDIATSAALVGFGGWIALSAWRELHPPAGHTHFHWHRHDHPHPHPSAPNRGGEIGHGALAWAGAPAIDDDPLYVPLRSDTAVLTRHAHPHRHGGAAPHVHWHDHPPATAHPVLAGFADDPPAHWHRHKTTARTALLLILGSSPMVEGIPAFFAAARYGAPLLGAMAAVFALSTIATYVVLCVSSSAGLQRLRFGAVERYGEVASGAVIALLGAAFGMWPAL
jgi:hypothetical protein